MLFLNAEVELAPWVPLLRAGASLESALEAPRWAFTIEGERDPARLAAKLLWAVTRQHALLDGNKRASICLADRFLALNGLHLEGADDELYWTAYDAAAGAADFELTAKRLALLVSAGAPAEPFELRYPDVIDRLAR
jgi:death-on-curing protein